MKRGGSEGRREQGRGKGKGRREWKEEGVKGRKEGMRGIRGEGRMK